MDLKRTSRFLAMLRRNGVTRYRDGKLEVDIGPTVMPFPVERAKEIMDSLPLPGDWTPSAPRQSDIDLALHPVDYDPDESEGN